MQTTELVPLIEAYIAASGQTTVFISGFDANGYQGAASLSLEGTPEELAHFLPARLNTALGLLCGGLMKGKDNAAN